MDSVVDLDFFKI